MSRILLTALIALAISRSGVAQHKEQHSERKTAQLNFVIVKNNNGKPVRNAEIVLHPIDKTGKVKQESVELKTHEDGKATIGGIPYGKLRVQVIAHGLRTYGEDYDIQEPTHDITIKMQNPADQYSIYK